jgi:hypothetical protein
MMHRELVIYMLPVIGIALVLGKLSRHVYWFAAITFVGTTAHEVMHLVFGYLTNAKPSHFSLLPKRQEDGGLELGLAPLFMAPLVIALAQLRVEGGWDLEVKDFGNWFLFGVMLVSAKPSAADMRIAGRSWPLLIIGAGGVAVWPKVAGFLSQFV